MRSMTFSDVKKFFTSWRGMCLLAVLVLAVLICVPPWQVERVRGRLEQPVDAVRLASLEDEYRRTLAQILAGGGLLVGLYLGWRRVRAAEEGQITERFTKAIEQLGQEGDDNMAIRLGGIYALERLAKDSEKDHGPIMEVLTAYVREKAPKRGKYAEEAAPRPPTDIQAILTVIGRRETTGENRGTDRLDLGNTRLPRANLGGAVLRGANLHGANLTVAYLNGADLRGAILHEANLSGALLAGADLRGASLAGADLRGASLHEANLDGASLDARIFGGAKNLTAAQVQSAKNWREAHLPDYLQHLKDLPA